MEMEEEEAKYKLIWKVGAEGQYLIWPPRSYCCSFCSKEFMSAQALGGHMNVHRRDRARLNKLSTIRPTEEFSPNHVQINQCKSDKLIIWVAASSSSSSSGSGSQGEKVLKKQKLWEDLTVQITTEKEGDPNPATSKYNLQNLVGVKDCGEATEDLDLELRL